MSPEPRQLLPIGWQEAPCPSNPHCWSLTHHLRDKEDRPHLEPYCARRESPERGQALGHSGSQVSRKMVIKPETHFPRVTLA